MSHKKSKLTLAMATAAGLAFSSGAFATNGIISAGNGMVAHGFGGAGLSNAGEAAAGMDNPALISQTGDSLAVAFSIFMPDRSVDTTAVNTSAFAVPNAGTVANSDSKLFAIPQIAYTSKVNDALSWGIMVNALGGMNSDYRTGPFPGLGQTAPQTTNLQGMIVAPTMSFAFDKNLSVGASLLIGYTTLTTRNLFGQSPGGTNEGSATGWGVKLGTDWKITDSISLGAIIQPKIEMEEIGYFKNFLGVVSQNTFTGDAALTLPNEIGIGGKFGIGKSVDIIADIMYYEWTSVDVFKFFGWEDQIVYKIGAEYRPAEKWALRAGFNYGESPIKGGNRTESGSQDAAFANYPFPAISETHVTLGLGYKMDKNMTINAYYLYSPKNCETATGPSQTSAPLPFPAGTEICMTQNAFGLGVNYAAK